MSKDVDARIRSYAGVDEAGRGAIAGPLVAAAVVLQNMPGPIFMDSKKLSEKKRFRLYRCLKQSKSDIGIGIVMPREIEALNIHFATLKAMKKALQNLKNPPEAVKVDGIFCPDFDAEIVAIPKGDEKFQAISAASIVAKVFRDYLMIRLDRSFPAYKFAAHKGYPTKEHKLAISQHGILVSHRTSFGPVRSVALKSEL